MLIIPCMAGMLSGCWDNKDINHRSLPITMGVSMVGETYKVILLIPEPVERTTKVRIVYGIGKTITEAVDHISRDMESDIDMLHMKVVVFDKPSAEKGMTDSISGFMRARDISPKAVVVICDEDIDHFFKRTKQTMEPSGTTLYNYFEKNAGWSPEVALTRIWQVYRSIYSFTRDVAIPVVKSGNDTMMQHLGSAIIKNGRMVGQISSEETLLFNAFNGESAHGKIEVMQHSSVLIVSNTMSHESKVVNNQMYMTSRINLNVSILETSSHVTNDSIKKELDSTLTDRCNALLAKIQSSEADILGLGQFFRNKIPRAELKNWRTEYLPRLKMDFSVRTVIQNEGNLKTPRRK
ncbi:Ger(x)C family spore germination protein [Cohnella luojiensis]|uniref:Ger(X)C family spore germination protein n=2 Tax=Cohnella luojiensis TaxID=652876 RepID=A0A4Y8LTH9_9BACL|nr:Ger(x)C family spore germination protein [Cohnella luojiensis]